MNDPAPWGAERVTLRMAAGMVVVSLLVSQLWLWSFTADDAYISLRYVENAGRGLGLVFNRGERVEGFSHPLWIAMLLLGRYVVGSGAPLVLWAKGIGLLATIASGLGLVALSRRCATGPLAPPLAAVLFLAVPGVHLYATEGLETPLLGALLVGAVVLTAERRGAEMVALLLGLAAVTRPEGVLYGGAWLIAGGVPRGRRGIRPLLLLAMPPVLYELVRLQYYGALLPNTFYAKPPGIFGGGALAYLVPILVLPPMPLVLVGVFGATAPAERAAVRLASAFLMAALAFVIYARSDWMPFGRLLVPVWPLACWLAVRGVGSLARSPGRRALLSVGAMACALVASFAMTGRALRRAEVWELMRGDAMRAGGRWLTAHAAVGETVATVRLGGLAYELADRPVWDMAGLTDRDAGRHVARAGRIAWAGNPVAARRPDWIAVASDTKRRFPHDDPDLAATLARDYRLVGTVPQAPSCEWRMYRRVSAP